MKKIALIIFVFWGSLQLAEPDIVIKFSENRIEKVKKVLTNRTAKIIYAAIGITAGGVIVWLYCKNRHQSNKNSANSEASTKTSEKSIQREIGKSNIIDTKDMTHDQVASLIAKMEACQQQKMKIGQHIITVYREDNQKVVYLFEQSWKDVTNWDMYLPIKDINKDLSSIIILLYLQKGINSYDIFTTDKQLYETTYSQYQSDDPIKWKLLGNPTCPVPTKT